MRTCGILFVALHNHMKAGPTLGTRVMLKYLRRVRRQSDLIHCVYTVFSIFGFCELYDFALLMLLTTFQTTKKSTCSLSYTSIP